MNFVAFVVVVAAAAAAAAVVVVGGGGADADAAHVDLAFSDAFQQKGRGHWDETFKAESQIRRPVQMAFLNSLQRLRWPVFKYLLGDQMVLFVFIV